MNLSPKWLLLEAQIDTPFYNVSDTWANSNAFKLNKLSIKNTFVVVASKVCRSVHIQLQTKLCDEHKTMKILTINICVCVRLLKSKQHSNFHHLPPHTLIAEHESQQIIWAVVGQLWIRNKIHFQHSSRFDPGYFELAGMNSFSSKVTLLLLGQDLVWIKYISWVLWTCHLSSFSSEVKLIHYLIICPSHELINGSNSTNFQSCFGEVRIWIGNWTCF